MTQEQKDILLMAGIGDATDVSRYGSGHINETYKVETASRVCHFDLAKRRFKPMATRVWRTSPP